MIKWLLIISVFNKASTLKSFIFEGLTHTSKQFSSTSIIYWMWIACTHNSILKIDEKSILPNTLHCDLRGSR